MTTAGATPVLDRPGPPEPAHQVTVRHLGRDRFAIALGEHTITVDQPMVDGGEGTAPTPTELFAGSLAGCVAFYARRYCARHDIDPEGMRVDADFTVGGRPARVETITMTITPPRALPLARYAPLLAVASHCTVHNTLAVPPAIHIEFAGDTE